MPQLINTATTNATFGTTEFFDTSTVTVEIPAIRITKSSDAVNDMWIGDELTYTILVKNIEEAGGIQATSVRVTDTIDPTLAALVEGSVTVDGSVITPPAYTFDPATGLLTIPLEDIDPGVEVVITFRVEKK